MTVSAVTQQQQQQQVSSTSTTTSTTSFSVGSSSHHHQQQQPSGDGHHNSAAQATAGGAGGGPGGSHPQPGSINAALKASPQKKMAITMPRPISPNNSSGSDTDPVISSSSASTALRRLYFKSRNSKTRGPTVPKVIVMGSSTASNSEATINTSTESASTLITNVTSNTDTETCDSLDLGENSGQSEPLLSSLDEPSHSISSLLSPKQHLIAAAKDSDQEQLISEPTVRYQKRSSQHLQQQPSSSISEDDDLIEISALEGRMNHHQPRTAPAITAQSRFPFDPPNSPRSVRAYEKTQSKFTFENHHENRKYATTKFVESSSSSSSSPSSVSVNTVTMISSRLDLDKGDQDKENKFAKDCSPRYSPNKSSGKGTEQWETSPRIGLREKTNSKKRIHSAPIVSSGHGNNKERFKVTNDSTMFPFDREALDYERIQRECFAVEEETKFTYELDTDPDSPIYEKAAIFQSPSKSSYRKSPYFYESNELIDHYHGGSNKRDDIFSQYTFLSQQEQKISKEKERRSPNLKRSKYQNRKTDAFSPKSNCNNNENSDSPMVLKFDQIATKFDQIPPNSKSHNKLNAHYSKHCPKALSPTLVDKCQMSPTNTVVRITPPLPDLRVDFFSTERSSHDDQPAAAATSSCSSAENDESDGKLDAGQKNAQQAGSINVTPNPMEAPVCTQPRATIVVQQASLSLDNSVETLLLRHEGDFISVEQGKDSIRRKKQQREESMRQLLDVTNKFTSEEIRDFEMRYGSPHHNRSQSVKTPGSRASGRPNQLSLPQQRSRVASMPNTGVEEEYYRLRHFSITGKGVINRGDSLKSRRSRSNNSVASSNSSTEHLTANIVVVGGGGQGGGGSARTSATCSLASSRESSTSNPGAGPYRVLMLGGASVGKSSLVSQFMTSEYLHAYDTSIDDESGEKAVSVLLSGEESELIFIDHSTAEMSPENCLSSYDPHGYCVIYSSADRDSFSLAERVLQGLWTSENIVQRAVILVANKADLARSRVVSSEEGKAMATAYDCKFIETSVGINHNVDELLVGLLSQIRLKLENPEKSRDLFRKRSYRKSKRRACSPLGVAATACLTGGNGGTNPSSPIGPMTPAMLFQSESTNQTGSAQSSPRKYRGSRTSASLKVKGLLGRVWARDSKSKSCENLHVL